MSVRVFEYRQAAELADAFDRHGVRYLLIGKSGAVVLGFPDTTQDVDVFLSKGDQTGAGVVSALSELGFQLDADRRREIESGKDFIQLKDGPFDIDLIYAPDGIERFDDAWRRRVNSGGVLACHPDDIIASKEASGRRKDRESLPRLKAFRDWWLARNADLPPPEDGSR